MQLTLENITQILLLGGSLLLTIQGIVTLIWMLYAWQNPYESDKRRSPDKFEDPKYSFTALVPMRFEENVAKDTISAIFNINYPDHLKDIIIICRHDDKATINKAQEVITSLGNENNAVLVLVDTYPINKPLSLNHGLTLVKNQIVTIFDAEDEPHPDIYNIINTVLVQDNVDVVQSGVQLMNYNSNWFSTLNVMEYFLWFKSGLQFFTDIGSVSPLGGNTVFFKKKFLHQIQGWDEDALTEDADIGIRLTLAGARTKVIYDERHVTKEETPGDIEGFIKQRTRWNQGFLQIIVKGDWAKLPTLKQKVFSLCVLLAPFFPLFLFGFIPLGLIINFTQEIAIPVAIFTYIPFFVLIAIICVQVVGLWEFTRVYNLKYKWYFPLKIIFTFFPYMAILAYSSGRAIARYFNSSNSWEKTLHLNIHRSIN